MRCGKKKKPVRPDGRAGFRAVWMSIIFQCGEFFQRLCDGLTLLHLVNAPAQGFHVGWLIEWLGRVFRAGLLSVGLIVRGCGCCTASSMGGWVSDLGRMGMCCVCPGMPLGVLLPVLLRCVVLLERGSYVGLGFFPTSPCNARGRVCTGPLLARAAYCIYVCPACKH